MAEIIASTYQIIHKIGAGGGGTVYLANHLRLGKQVVLKADKRKADTNPILLRREVDVLKDLSNPYIPQVYDYFVEKDTVYTVIDYIEGESLDRPLKRGERFSQPQVIHWARQLLEAVVYLHAPTHGTPPRGYVHSDIKPANLMCRPNGDICLIDFNIALALGEENVVGISAGYSSPEHYGYDFSMVGPTGSSSDSVTLSEETVLMPPSVARSLSGISFNSSQKRVIPDERSDIFSVGATLYHLLSGRRPAPNALEVLPLGPEDASKPVADIINKAMQPNPALRYQSAVEMLNAFEDLYQNDPRSQRLRRRTRITRIALASVFLLGLLVGFSGLRLREAEQAEARVAAEQAEAEQRAARQEAEIREEAERLAKEEEQRANQAMEMISSSEALLKQGDRAGAVKVALAALELDTSYNALAQYTLTSALNVYDLSAGFRSTLTIDLPSEPVKSGLSPDGSRAFAIFDGTLAVFNTADGSQQVLLKAEPSVLSDARFLNEDRIVYAGADGVCCYDLATGQTIWQGKRGTKLAFSADGKRVASVFKDESEGILYDLTDGRVIQSVSFGIHKQSVPLDDIKVDPQRSFLALNADGTLLAAAFEDGTVGVYETDSGMEFLSVDTERELFTGGFYQNYLAFTGFKSGLGNESSLFVVVNMKDVNDRSVAVSSNRLRLQADETGIYLVGGNTMTVFDPRSKEQRELAYTTSSDIMAYIHTGDYTMVSSRDAIIRFFDRGGSLMSQIEGTESYEYLSLCEKTALAASTGSRSIRLFSLQEQRDKLILSYDPTMQHTEARINPEADTVLLASIQRLSLLSVQGTLLADLVIPESGNLLDFQYRRSEHDSWVELTYRDGRVVTYSSQDLSQLKEEQGQKPELSREEDFFTDRFRIHCRQNMAPVVYDLETNDELLTLDRNDSLAYVDQTGKGIILEYVAQRGTEIYRYGILVNEHFEPLAELPYLCDVIGDELFFDYPSGKIYHCSIHSLNDLKKLAN